MLTPTQGPFFMYVIGKPFFLYLLEHKETEEVQFSCPTANLLRFPALTCEYRSLASL